MSSSPFRHFARRALIVVPLLALTGAGGYWLGQRPAATGAAPVQTAASAGERQPLYYRNPMGLPDTSPTPKKDPMGMDYIAVYAADETGGGGGGAADDASPAAANEVRISSEKVQQLGVRSEAVERRPLARTVRAAGRVEPDERRLYAIAPKFEGYVERLHANTTGQPIARGQALFDVYSPELVAAQREYAVAAQGVATLADAGAQDAMRQLAEASLARLRNWDVSEAQVKDLARSGQVQRTLSFLSPVAGVVTSRKALQGMRFMPGETLYEVADLSSVWVVADVAEQDIGAVRLGAPASVRVNAYPNKPLAGKVSYVYPTLDAATRSVAVRIELSNPGLLLKPAMYAQVELGADPGGAAGGAGGAGGVTAVLSVPRSAVIDSGLRQVVLVDRGDGRFAPREVKLGARDERYVEVVDGLKEGERVVTAANFLIDAESNLKAALDGLGARSETVPGVAAAPAAASAGSHHAEGRVEEVDAKAGTVSLAHGPVASLKWPAMSMEFVVANAALLPVFKPGATVAVDFVERAAGEWVIVGARPLAAKPGPAADAGQPTHTLH